MTDYLSKEPLKDRLQQILAGENMDAQRNLITTLARELKIDSLSCASALLYLLETSATPVAVAQTISHTDHPIGANKPYVGIKMVRYRLDVGSKHRVTSEQLKQVLVDESGVDKNNINNINIQNLYTLIELPDEMPPDIFQHLKLVEINQQKLDIRRVKPRNHKNRSGNQNRRGRKRDTKFSPEPGLTANGNSLAD